MLRPSDIEKFFGRWFIAVVRPARGLFEAITFWLTIGVGVLTLTSPAWGTKVSSSIPTLTAAIFLALVALRFVLAPFWIYREAVAERDAALAREKKLNEELAELRAGKRQPRLEFEFTPDAFPYRAEFLKEEPHNRDGLNIVYGAILENAGQYDLDDVKLNLLFCLPMNGHGFNALEDVRFPLPAPEESDTGRDPAVHRTRFALRAGERLLFRLARHRPEGVYAHDLELCLAGHEDGVGLTIFAPPQRYRILLRAHVGEAFFDQWFELTTDKRHRLEMRALEAPNLQHMTPELLDEFEAVLADVFDAGHAAINPPRARLAEFRDHLDQLMSALGKRRSRMDELTWTIVNNAIVASRYAALELYARHEDLDPGMPEHRLTQFLGEIRGYREALTHWFGMARRLLDEQRERGGVRTQ